MGNLILSALAVGLAGLCYTYIVFWAGFVLQNWCFRHNLFPVLLPTLHTATFLMLPLILIGVYTP